jgi:hypothetical protein
MSAPRPALTVRTAALLAALVLLFAASYTQRPNYYSNQNHRFVHGLARADYGQLRADWLAATADPSPVFSKIVELTHRFGDPALYYVYQSGLMAVYVLGLAALGARFLGPGGNRVGWAVFAALLLVVHSAWLAVRTKRELGVDVRELLVEGVAQQYVLGPMFQPSALGALLILSIALFVAGRPYAAVLAFSVANAIYSAYLLSAALLTVSYAVALVRGGRRRDAVLVPVLALVLALPVVVHTGATFGPSDDETFARANHILARIRIPHHTDAAQWFDDTVGVKLLLVACGTWLARAAPLGPVMGVTLVAVLALTGLQLALDSDALALLFPWRPSVWLVPVATTVLLARLSGAVGAWVGSSPRAPIVLALCALLAAGAAAGGVVVMRGWVNHVPRERGAYLFVRQQLSPGQLWLTPRSLETFRLATGAPIYADYKSHPYKDAEVLEWYQRLERTDEWVDALAHGDTTALRAIVAEGKVTHVLVAAPIALDPSCAELVYEDRVYRAYRLRPPPGEPTNRSVATDPRP